MTVLIWDLIICAFGTLFQIYKDAIQKQRKTKSKIINYREAHHKTTFHSHMLLSRYIKDLKKMTRTKVHKLKLMTVI